MFMPSRLLPRAADPLHGPYELERTVARAHPGVRARTCAVSAATDGLVVTTQLTSPDTDPASVEHAIRLALAIDHGLTVYRLIITHPDLAAALA
jgi:hypothetical protein